MDSTGAAVDCDTTGASGQTTGAISCAPGQYVAQIGLSGADAANASISVSDDGPSELRVSTPAQAAAGSDFTLEAGVYENDVRQTGSTFTASLDGDTVVLHDDGIAPDSVAGDGVFSGTLTAPASGTADVTLAASGTDAEGAAYARDAEALVSVAVPRATLSGSLHLAYDDRDLGQSRRTALRRRRPCRARLHAPGRWHSDERR